MFPNSLYVKKITGPKSLPFTYISYTVQTLVIVPYSSPIRKCHVWLRRPNICTPAPKYKDWTGLVQVCKQKDQTKIKWSFQKLSVTKNLPLKWCSLMKFFFWKIWIIFDRENWLWKSEIGTFRSLDLELTLIQQKTFNMK